MTPHTRGFSTSVPSVCILDIQFVHPMTAIRRQNRIPNLRITEKPLSQRKFSVQIAPPIISCKLYSVNLESLYYTTLKDYFEGNSRRVDYRQNLLGDDTMDWMAIGSRIRTQREYLGYTREQFAELLDVTPKFCSDIELGVKGMSVPTLCKISRILRLKTDYILFGRQEAAFSEPLALLLESCTDTERVYAEQLLRTFLIAMTAKKEPS